MLGSGSFDNSTVYYKIDPARQRAEEETINPNPITGDTSYATKFDQITE
jgi:hypothetical protein